MKYLNPELMNSVETDASGVYYTIIGDQLQIRPPQDNKILEVTYYQKLLELGEVNTENWLSQDYPDAYVFGLMVEISAFTKDVDSGQLWESRFVETLNSIDNQDIKNRWSGTPLEVRIG